MCDRTTNVLRLPDKGVEGFSHCVLARDCAKAPFYFLNLLNFLSFLYLLR